MSESQTTPEPLPVLYRDGVNDDTPAWQAMLLGRDVMLPDGTIWRAANYATLPYRA